MPRRRVARVQPTHDSPYIQELRKKIKDSKKENLELQEKITKHEKLFKQEKKQHIAAKSHSTQYYRKCVTQMKLNSTMEMDIYKAERDLKLFQTCEDAQKAKEIMEIHQKKTADVRGRMMEVQETMKKGIQVMSDREKRPWKTCEVCLDEYGYSDAKIPRVLPCGHCMCHECLEKLHDDGYIRCPIDRTYHKIQADQIKILPKNFLVLDM